MQSILHSLLPDWLNTVIVYGSYAYNVVNDVLDKVHKSKTFEWFSFWCELWSNVYTADKVEIIFRNSTDITQKYDQSVVYSVPAEYLPRYWLSPLIHDIFKCLSPVITDIFICLYCIMTLQTIIFCFGCCCRSRRN
jgi:hypothetical protein